jgi:hypothetical protein
MKLAVGMLASAWTVEPTYDRGLHVPGRREVVKIIAISDKQITVQTIDGMFKVLARSSVVPLPDYFLTKENV